MDDVNPVRMIVHEIQGEFHIDRVLVGVLDRSEDLPHIGDEVGRGKQIVECWDPCLARARRDAIDGLVEGGEHLHRHIGVLRYDIEKMAGHEPVGLQIEVVHAPLGVLTDLLEVRFRPALRSVEGDEPGVVVVRAIDGPGAQAEDQPQHARLRIDTLVPRRRD